LQRRGEWRQLSQYVGIGTVGGPGYGATTVIFQGENVWPLADVNQIVVVPGVKAYAKPS
jgi:hypothetical protein